MSGREKLPEQKNPYHIHYCTFLFNPDVIVALEGDFLDKMAQSVKKIRTALSDQDPRVQKNDKFLIKFMKQIMK